jgi:hypothetical protein
MINLNPCKPLPDKAKITLPLIPSHPREGKVLMIIFENIINRQPPKGDGK